MSDDIRLDVEFFGHPKTQRLRRRLGDAGIISLIKLWIYTARYFAKGTLTGLTAEEVVDAAGWTGNPNEFIAALIEAGGPGKAGFLDVLGKEYSLHNWKARNRYAYFKPERKAQSQRANDARWSNKRQTKQILDPDRNADRNADRDPVSDTPSSSSSSSSLPKDKDMSSPSDDPPVVIPEEVKGVWNEAAEHYQKKDPENRIPKVLKLSPERIKNCTARAQSLRIDKKILKDILTAMHNSDFLAGKNSSNNGHGKWVANFDWVFGKSDGNIMKILEGVYE